MARIGSGAASSRWDGARVGRHNFVPEVRPDGICYYIRLPIVENSSRALPFVLLHLIKLGSNLRRFFNGVALVLKNMGRLQKWL
eukprot:3358429-Pyramimonas_sp.AAC.1